MRYKTLGNFNDCVKKNLVKIENHQKPTIYNIVSDYPKDLINKHIKKFKSTNSFDPENEPHIQDNVNRDLVLLNKSVSILKLYDIIEYDI